MHPQACGVGQQLGGCNFLAMGNGVIVVGVAGQISNQLLESLVDLQQNKHLKSIHTKQK
jgi:hypothetical protein